MNEKIKFILNSHGLYNKTKKHYDFKFLENEFIKEIDSRDILISLSDGNLNCYLVYYNPDGTILKNKFIGNSKLNLKTLNSDISKLLDMIYKYFMGINNDK